MPLAKGKAPLFGGASLLLSTVGPAALLALALLAALLLPAALAVRILLLLSGLLATTLLLAGLLAGRLILLARILVLIGHSAISCVEPFNDATTSGAKVGFCSLVIIARRFDDKCGGGTALRCDKKYAMCSSL